MPKPTPESPELSFEMHFDGCNDLLKEIEDSADRLSSLALMFDSLGDANCHPEGSDKRRLAALRDHADFCLSRAASSLSCHMRVRAESSRSVDLVADSVITARGNGEDCIKLMNIYYQLMGDDTEGTGKIGPETFPDQFLWDLNQRVEDLPALAEKYPKHLYFAARHLQGLPMIVSHHLNIAPEFQRLSEILGLGSQHPLDVSPRKKKGGITPTMRYLEPLVWRLSSMQGILKNEVHREGEFIKSDRIAWLWTYSYREATPEDQIEILRKLVLLPNLSKTSASIWAREVIVPFILVTDGANPSSSEEPFLCNIWAHRAVKSIPTFRSRLESAVTAFLKRYGRAE